MTNSPVKSTLSLHTVSRKLTTLHDEAKNDDVMPKSTAAFRDSLWTY